MEYFVALRKYLMYRKYLIITYTYMSFLIKDVTISLHVSRSLSIRVTQGYRIESVWSSPEAQVLVDQEAHQYFSTNYKNVNN